MLSVFPLYSVIIFVPCPPSPETAGHHTQHTSCNPYSTKHWLPLTPILCFDSSVHWLEPWNTSCQDRCRNSGTTCTAFSNTSSHLAQARADGSYRAATSKPTSLSAWVMRITGNFVHRELFEQIVRRVLRRKKEKKKRVSSHTSQ